MKLSPVFPSMSVVLRHFGLCPMSSLERSMNWLMLRELSEFYAMGSTINDF
jgi:hypothetical protein